ncbi:MAG: lytic murein transglycosylase B [Sterolibacterium sp.]|nr:lytic murein transglycosylase B [Sterolibacterium sp.]
MNPYLTRRQPLIQSPQVSALLFALLFSGNTLAATPTPPAAYAAHEEVQAFVRQMQDKHGFAADSLLPLFADMYPLKPVIRAVMPPKDPQVRSWTNYRARFVDASRINDGVRFWHEQQQTLAKARQDSGVPEEYIVAIIGIESIYGRHMGSFNTLAALTTLAFDYPAINPDSDARRKALFRSELEALLLLSRETRRDPLAYRGSYAGALGLPQFLPSSIRSFARDGDNDGRINLETSPADAIASVANFLKQHGWQADGTVCLPAQVSDERHQALIAEGILPRRPISELRAHGVTTVDIPPTLAGEAAALIDLVTPGQATEYRLGLQNFYVITRYNRSSFYAMAVHDLAQALRARLRAQAVLTEARDGTMR